MMDARRPLRAALVTVGDELLLGKTVDTNAAWLGTGLGGLGIPVARSHTVGDVAAEIQGAVAAALSVADLVLVTGGLGPPPDDLTRDAVADLLGLPLVEDPEVLESLRARFRERGRGDLPEPNRRVAQVPAGAVKLSNPVGTAPGLAMDRGGALVVLLPGVPREMKAIFSGDLRQLVRERFPGRLSPVHLRVVHTTGIPESVLAQQIAEHLPGGPDPVRLAFLPDLRGVDLRFQAVDMSEAEAEAHFDELDAALAPVLAPWRYASPSGDLAEAVSGALRQSRTRLAVAESCTGGLIAKRITDLPGASDVFVGGVVAYANDVKASALGVSGEDLAIHGAVSEAVAVAMAAGVAQALGAEAGIGVTGIAGPDGGSPAKPTGTVWYAVALRGTIEARMERFPGDREAVRERAAQAALFLLLRVLDGRVAPGARDRG
ncbi:MAG: competence/damage-inducible protein A [Gemmatimonadetes bacterium]|nr:competence/damage-inducible protein A [Gemmatimonadota bacterium]